MFFISTFIIYTERKRANMRLRVERKTKFDASREVVKRRIFRSFLCVRSVERVRVSVTEFDM